MRGKSFTLIEFLVVIAIFALLAAILLPALNQVRARTRAVSCVNVEKQPEQAESFYFTDSDDSLLGLTGNPDNVARYVQRNRYLWGKTAMPGLGCRKTGSIRKPVLKVSLYESHDYGTDFFPQRSGIRYITIWCGRVTAGPSA